MKKIILIVFCLLAFPVVASHIVGGEFELVHLGNYRFRLSLIYYFDLNNNTFTRPPEVEEPTVTVAIFRKSDNVFMRFVTLANPVKTRVSYTQPECSSGEIRTDKLVYFAELTLPANQYNSPDGYYVIWERCCRNYVVTNIVSDEPPNNSPNFQNAAGQTFYLHFPPVVKNNTAFINSSPRLFPPLNDYACPYKPYYADFGGTDDDGDSLVYSLVVPFSTHTAESFPPLRPAPYPPVRWEPGYGLHNIMNGNPDLRISRDGMLTVTPTTQGLYVFAVKCDEYRDGIKIGEIRRDFQMLVVDGCPQADPPQILGKRSTDAGFIHDGTMTVAFSNDVGDDDRCIQVRISDLDSSKPSTIPKDNEREVVKIKAIALGFKKDISDILPLTTNAVLIKGSTVDFNICFDKCPLTASGGPYQVGIVAYDDACSLPLTDTLKITVTVEPPDNAKPRFVITNDVNETFDEGDPKQTWAVDAVDADGDIMDMFMLMQQPFFNFDQAGMTFRTLPPQVGNTLRAEFTWDPNCKVYDFTNQTEFNLRFLVEDHDLCDLKDPDTLNFKLNITLPSNADPVISTDLPADQLAPNIISRKIFESLHFNVSGTDADNDKLVLRAEGDGFTLAQYSMTFPGDTDLGNVTSPYDWNILCSNVNPLQKQDFPLRFILVDDANKCRIYKADTLTVNVHVAPPDNLKPLLTVTNTNPDLTFVNREQSIILGQQISLALTATDDNNRPVDGIRIELVEATGNVEPRGYEFAPAEGIGSAQTTFTWLPDCSIFENAVYRNSYTFAFRAIDDRCFNVKADTLEVNININDVESRSEDFIPPNIITPNGDTFNEFFAMVREEHDSGALVSILPPDNCIGKFVSVHIYNRWGKEVYESNHRDFRWYPQSEAAGVYFYTLKYSNKDYKGSITVRN